MNLLLLALFILFLPSGRGHYECDLPSLPHESLDATNKSPHRADGRGKSRLDLSLEDSLWPYPSQISTTKGANGGFASIGNIVFEPGDSNANDLDFARTCTLLQKVYSGRNKTRTLMVNLDLEGSMKDEQYEIDASGDSMVLSLLASGRNGWHWGLETLVQVFSYQGLDDILSFRIKDSPSYPWRGISMDSARHFIPVPFFLNTLDRMSSNKMNVLHWHIVDASSFPLKLDCCPELAANGAFSKDKTYTRADVELIVERARNLSIMVVPEVDVPGHAASWGDAVLDCPWVLPLSQDDQDNPFKKMDLQVLDVSKPSTIRLVEDVVHEVAGMFPSKFFHIGVDEVDFRCWDSHPEFLKWKGKSTNAQILDDFIARVVSALNQTGKTPIAWQDGFEQGLSFSHRDTVMQTWKCWHTFESGALQSGYDMAKRARARGTRVIQSTCWYLDYDSQWYDYYGHGPKSGDSDARFAIGGEAALWTERMDQTNFDCRIWPRTAAIAERLWYGDDYPINETLRKRLAHHASRMQRTQGTMLGELGDIANLCPLLEDQSIQRPIHDEI